MHEKKSLPSLVIKEMQIKATMRYLYKTTGMAKNLKLSISSVNKNTVQLEFTSSVAGM